MFALHIMEKNKRTQVSPRHLMADSNKGRSFNGSKRIHEFGVRDDWKFCMITTRCHLIKKEIQASPVAWFVSVQGDKLFFFPC